MSLYDEIAKEAYDLYMKNGKIDGSDLEHWFEAEKIVMARQKDRKEERASKSAPKKAKTRK